MFNIFRWLLSSNSLEETTTLQQLTETLQGVELDGEKKDAVLLEEEESSWWIPENTAD
jgi:hypothetical protein